MSLLWLDSFESYGTTIGGAPSPTGIIGSKYVATGENYLDVDNGFAGRGIEINSSGVRFTTPAINTDPTLIVGFNYYLNSTSYDRTNKTLINLMQPSGYGVSLYHYNGEVYVRQGAYNGTILGNTTGLGLQRFTWYHIELKVFCDTTAGTYEVKIGGKTVLNGTGNTDKYTDTYFDRVRLNNEWTSKDIFDNLYVCNSLGTVNNNFLGNIQVRVARPDLDDTANFVTTTPSANHYANTNDEVSDENTSYSQDNTSGRRELYDHSTITGLDSVIGINQNARLRTNSGVSESFKHLTKSGATELASSNVSTANTAYFTFTNIVEQDPNISAAWTPTTVNAAKFGIELP